MSKVYKILIKIFVFMVILFLVACAYVYWESSGEVLTGNFFQEVFTEDFFQAAFVFLVFFLADYFLMVLLLLLLWLVFPAIMRYVGKHVK